MQGLQAQDSIDRRVSDFAEEQKIEGLSEALYRHRFSSRFSEQELAEITEAPEQQEQIVRKGKKKQKREKIELEK